MLITSIVNVTPNDAKEMLNNNYTKQRCIDMGSVLYFKREMERGNFSATASEIRISESGVLLDGQHRLRAVIEYGSPVEMRITRGLKEEDFKFIDTGMRTRNAYDHAVISGQDPVPAKILIPVFRYIETAEVSPNNPFRRLNKVEKRSDFELQEWGYKEHGAVLLGLYDTMKSMGKRDFKILEEAPMLYAYYEMHKVNKELAYEYVYNFQRDLKNKTSTERLITRTCEKVRAEGRIKKIHSPEVNKEIFSILAKGWWLMRSGKTNRTRVVNDAQDPNIGLDFSYPVSKHQDHNEIPLRSV